MEPGADCLVDTNILLRASRPRDLLYPLIRTALNHLEREKTRLFYSMQNAAEYWNVSTRPASSNGFGLSVEETYRNLLDVEVGMTLLPDTAEVYAEWKRIVVAHAIKGVQVHDAKLAATMIVHGIPRIISLNKADFARFPQIEVIDPADPLRR